jgi:hypothetical protein
MNGAAAGTPFDPADLEHCFARALQCVSRRRRLVWRDDHSHSDAAIERPRQLFRGNVSARLKHREHPWQLPSARIHDGMAAIWYNPRNILEKSAASDVRQTLDAALLHER